MYAIQDHGVHGSCRQLQPEKRNEEAFAIFSENAKKHPDMCFVHTRLARIYSSQGRFKDAAKEMRVALLATPVSQKSYLDGLASQLDAKHYINR